MFWDVVSLLAVSQNWPVAAPGCETKSMGRMNEQEFESSKSSVEIKMKQNEPCQHFASKPWLPSHHVLNHGLTWSNFLRWLPLIYFESLFFFHLGPLLLYVDFSLGYSDSILFSGVPTPPCNIESNDITIYCKTICLIGLSCYCLTVENIQKLGHIHKKVCRCVLETCFLHQGVLVQRSLCHHWPISRLEDSGESELETKKKGACFRAPNRRSSQKPTRGLDTILFHPCPGEWCVFVWRT